MIATEKTTKLERYFQQYRENIIGIDQEFVSPYGTKKIIYTDWTASGRLYRPIEEKLMNEFGPFVANTHTETTISGTAMTKAYHKARHIIKHHVNASEDDILITDGTGMTGVVNKFQRILGLRVPENLKDFITIPAEKKPVVFISHMEHHSNQTTWLETIADVVVIPSNDEGLFCMENFKTILEQYKDRTFKIATLTAGSNVTGIRTPYHEVAKVMHANNGLCFVDFACSGPYVTIDMHPANDPEAYLDATFFRLINFWAVLELQEYLYLIKNYIKISCLIIQEEELFHGQIHGVNISLSIILKIVKMEEHQGFYKS